MQSVKTIPSGAFRRPNEILGNLVAANLELIYARDAELGKVLDVAPPPVDVPYTPPPPQLRPGDSRGLTYRAARKIYRKLKNNQQLKPILERVRHELLTRT